jgi:hypothetical protein
MNPKPLPAIALAATLLAASLTVYAESRRTVVIAPIQVAFDKNWLPNMNQSRGRAHSVDAEDARRIAADMAASLHNALDEAVRARGFEVVSSAPDALRLSASIDDLYVNAPDIAAPGITKTFVREAGRATLRAEGRDASGAVRLQSELRGTAGDTGRLSRASSVTNRFWFDALFRTWANEVAGELSQRAAR